MLVLIQAYRYLISPYLGNHCRFYPSCSAYAEQAFRQHGFFTALWLMTRRLLRCHPFHAGGYDPLETIATNNRTFSDSVSSAQELVKQPLRRR